MTRDSRPRFRELRRVFAGYLHEDVLAESGTPEEALRTYRQDASPAELRRFQKEAKQLLEYSENLDLDQLRELLFKLGARWTTPSREALAMLLSRATDPNES